MINNFDGALDFQRQQQEASIMVGAALATLKDFLEKCEADLTYADDINNIRRLLLYTQDTKFSNIRGFFDKFGYNLYFETIVSMHESLHYFLQRQTLPSEKSGSADFLKSFKKYFNQMAECQIAIAQIPLPNVDLSIKANTPFQAFCFFTDMFSTARKFLYIVDRYIDTSIFYCYLYRLPKDLEIKIVSLSDKWGNRMKEQVEAVEELFKTEYPSYSRKDNPCIHDRYIITETGAFEIGGSIKDAAKKSSFSVKSLSEPRHSELIKEYFS